MQREPYILIYTRHHKTNKKLYSCFSFSFHCCHSSALAGGFIRYKMGIWSVKDWKWNVCRYDSSEKM